MGHSSKRRPSPFRPRWYRRPSRRCTRCPSGSAAAGLGWPKRSHRSRKCCWQADRSLSVALPATCVMNCCGVISGDCSDPRGTPVGGTVTVAVGWAERSESHRFGATTWRDPPLQHKQLSPRTLPEVEGSRFGSPAAGASTCQTVFESGQIQLLFLMPGKYFLGLRRLSPKGWPRRNLRRRANRAMAAAKAMRQKKF